MGKSILPKDEAERIAVDFTPRKLPSRISPAAASFVAFNSRAGRSESSFKIDRLVAEQTGVAELERLSLEERVELEALNRLKVIQEEAYQEAHRLGLDEGREKAFQEKKAEFDEKIHHLQELLSSMETLKTDLVASNETQIVRLAFYMAKRLLLTEASTRQEIVLDVIKQTIASAQSDERVTVRVSPNDLAFIESVKESLGKDFDSVKRARIESSEDIQDGGCVVETNYGDVSATIEQRLDKLWETIAEKLPKVKNIVGG